MNVFSQMLQAISLKYPDNTAIEYGKNVAITYAELEQYVNHYVIKLKQSGLITGSVAAVTLDKSIDYIVALLALWRMDCVLLPLIPELPELRRNYILDIAKPNALINVDGIQIIHSQVLAHTKNLAALFFTSGSTGKPKGVMVPHNGLVNVLEQQIQLFNLNAASRSLFLLSPQFDASLSDIGTTLLSGACLVIEPDSNLLLASRIYEVIEKKLITHVDIPPALLARLDPNNLPASINTLIIGGETCPIKTINAFSRHCKLINVYGPTEATICTSMILCSPNSDEVYIGEPIPPNEYLIVDDELNPLDGEVNGELLISSPGLAPGYLNEPELTDKKFIQIQGTRYFRTGDVVKRNKNNQITILGRKDRQLKIRGQLVCLEEIEQTLKRIPYVTNSLVIPFTRRNKTTQLIAFVESDNQIEPDFITGQLKSMLPEWMIPSKYYPLTQLFTNLNGKIDLNAHLDYLELIESNQAQLAEQNNHESVNYLEKTLQFIWQSTLELEQLPNLDSHFFHDLGGDSLAAIEMSLNCGKQGIKLPLGTVEHLSTIRLLGQWLSTHQNTLTDAFVMTGTQLITIADKEKEAIDEFIQQIKPNRRSESTKQLSTAVEFRRTSYEKTILLTGCTGFIGSYLLASLLRSKVNIICLVRSTSNSNARLRVIKQLNHNGLSVPQEHLDSLEILAADLSQDFLGLDQNIWLALTNKVDEVFHLAAAVNMTAPFDMLYSDNVHATAQVLRFCLTNKKKKLHYASTLSVLISKNQDAELDYKESQLNQLAEINGGYAQTKWAAEYLVNHYLLQIPINIFRLGLITGNSFNGHSGQNDLLMNFLETLIISQSIPALSRENDYFLNPTPVDYTVDAMLYISQNDESGYFHIINDTHCSLSTINQALLQNIPNIKKVPLEQWREELLFHLKLDKKYLATYLSVYNQLEDINQIRYNALDLFQITNINIMQDNTKKALLNSNLYCPHADTHLLNKYITYCQTQLKPNDGQQTDNNHVNENN